MTSPLVKPAVGYITLSRLDSSRSRPAMDTANRSPAILVLLDALVRRLVGTQLQEARETQPSVRRAVAVAQLDDQFGTYPVRSAGILPRDRSGCERGRFGGERLQ